MTAAQRESSPNPPVVYRMEEHQGWGDLIEWGWSEDPSRLQGRRVQGCLRRRPSAGDMLPVKSCAGELCRFVFTEVEMKQNPPDLFIGKVGFVGVESEAA